jgi:glucosyl-dolichyl phosphate glucuronosyltransferase
MQGKLATHDISVIICAYTEKRLRDLLTAISSVQQQTLAPTEIIVVIDHNLPLFKQVREQACGVMVVENAEAPGLSGSRNSGIAVARGDILAFLDDDAIATPDWLRLLSDAFADPRLLGIGGSIVPLWLDHDPLWLPEEFYWVVGCTYKGLPSGSSAIRNPIGANMSFRREVFDMVGGFRGEIGRIGTRPVGCEETELSIRAYQCWPQGRFLYQPLAQVFHRVPAGRSCWRYFCSRCYAEGLSKALVTRYVGARDGLASERMYVLSTLPHGVVHNIKEGITRHDVNGFLRAGAIIAGLAMTTVGYLTGTICCCFKPDHRGGKTWWLSPSLVRARYPHQPKKSRGNA